MKRRWTLCIVATMFVAMLPLCSQPTDIVWKRGGGHFGRVTATALSPDGSLVATADASGRIHIQRSDSGMIVRTIRFASLGDHFLHFSRSGEELMLVQPGVAITWDIGTGIARSFPIPSDQLAQAFLLAGGERLALVGSNGIVRVYDAARGDSIDQFDLGTGDISSVHLAADSSIFVFAGQDRVVRGWDIAARSLLPATVAIYDGHDARLLAVSPRSTILAGHLSDSTIGLWDISTGALVDTLFLRAFFGASLDDYLLWKSGINPIVAGAFSGTGDTLVLHSDVGGIVVVDTRTGTTLHVFGDGFEYAGMMFPDTPGLGISSEILLSSIPGTIVLVAHKYASDYGASRLDIYLARYELAPDSGAGPRERMEFTPNQAAVTDVTMLPDGRSAITIAGAMLMTWNLPNGIYRPQRLAAPQITYWAIAPDGSGVLSYESVFLSAPHFPTGPVVNATLSGGMLPGLTPAVSVVPSEMAVSPGGRYALIGGRLYSSSGSFVTLPITGFRAVAFSYDTIHLALMRADTLFLWNCREGKVERAFAPPASLLVTAFSRNGALLACGLENGETVVYDIVTGDETARLSGHRGPITAVAFGQHDRFAVTSGVDSTIRTWHLATGANDYTYQEYPGVTTSLDVTADGRHILAGTEDGAVILWRGKGAIAEVYWLHEEIGSITLHPNPIVNDEIVVSVGKYSGMVTVDVINAAGTVVATHQAQARANGTAVLNVSGTRAGYYLCRVTRGASSVCMPVVIVR